MTAPRYVVNRTRYGYEVVDTAENCVMCSTPATSCSAPLPDGVGPYKFKEPAERIAAALNAYNQQEQEPKT